MPNTPILGLDVGDKYIGIALSDTEQLLAHPVATFQRAGGKAESAILSLIAERQIKTVVAGLPLGENGEKNQQCEKVENFLRRLQKRVDITLVLVDEYASSFAAEEQLREAGNRGRGLKQSGKLDAASAALILQSYLDSREQA